MTDEYVERCWYCGKPGKFPCDSEDCQQMDREMTEDLRKSRIKQEWQGFRAALRQRAKDADLYPKTRCKRWFYTFKLIVCFFCNLRYRGKKDYPDRVHVAHFNYRKLYAGWSEEYIRVGSGVFTGWWFDIEEDGDWYM